MYQHSLYIAGRIQGCDPCAGGEHPRHRPRALLQAQEGDLRPPQAGRQLAGSSSKRTHVVSLYSLYLRFSHKYCTVIDFCD